MENIMVLGEITNFDQNIPIPHPHSQIQKSWDAAWTFRRFSVGGQKTGNVLGHIPPIYVFSELCLILLLQALPAPGAAPKYGCMKDRDLRTVSK